MQTDKLHEGHEFARTLQEVGRRLRAAKSVAVLTGAGISVESGLSTFRDPDGLWEKYRPEDLANEHAFRQNPALVQSWYRWRRAQAEAAEPNPGHAALVEIERSGVDFTLITQNVDGLHRRAGSRNVIELHGTITEEYCIECGEPAPEHPAPIEKNTQPAPVAAPASEPTELRRCACCRGLLRPSVVWFGESLPAGAFEHAVKAAESADVFLSVGTSSIVYPAASLPLVAKQFGAYTVEVNVRSSAIADALDAVLLGPSGVLLPEIVRLAGRTGPTTDGISVDPYPNYRTEKLT